MFHSMAEFQMFPSALRTYFDSFADPGRSVLEHEVLWNPSAWRGVDLPGASGAIDELAQITLVESSGSHAISRNQVVEFGKSPDQLFLASMIWGFGTTGYGASRVAKMIASNGLSLSTKINQIIASAQQGPESAWDAITANSKIRGLGVAFGSKLAYFASLQADPDRPSILIADINTSRGIWNASGTEIKRSVEVRSAYRSYVKTAHEWATELRVRADLIEYALFKHGQSVLAERRARLKNEDGPIVG